MLTRITRVRSAVPRALTTAAAIAASARRMRVAAAAAAAVSTRPAAAAVSVRWLHASAARTAIGGISAPPSSAASAPPQRPPSTAAGSTPSAAGAGAGGAAPTASSAAAAAQADAEAAAAAIAAWASGPHVVRPDLPASAAEANIAAAASYTRAGNAIDPAFPRTEPHHLKRTNIEGYGDGAFQVNGLVFKGSILAFPTFTLLWSPTDWEQVTAAHLALIPLIEPKIKTLLFGGGAHTYMPSAEVIEFLARHGIGWEPMSTFNACATFSMLNAEERSVAAAIIAVPDKPAAQPLSDERLHQMALRERRLKGL